MAKLNPGSIPAVRRAWRSDVLMLAGFVSALAVLVLLGAALHPLVAAAIVGIGVLKVLDHVMVIVPLSRHRPLAGATLVHARFLSPVLWDAVHACAARAGIPPPRIYLLDLFVRFPAVSWDSGDGMAVGMQERLVEKLPPDWVKAAMAHEIAHIAMGDIAFSAMRVFVRSWLRIAALCLCLAGLVFVIGDFGPVKGLIALVACAASVLIYLGTDVAEAIAMPYLRYRREYAADALGVAITGDPVAAMGLMIFFAVGMRQMSRDPRPMPGGSHPPPLVRAEAILRDHKDAFLR